MRLDRPITKRQLGFILLILGLLAATAGLTFDLFGPGRFAGIGPAQRLAVLGGLLLAAFGGSLIPLGDRPA